jgi:hypothetical protein
MQLHSFLLCCACCGVVSWILTQCTFPGRERVRRGNPSMTAGTQSLERWVCLNNQFISGSGQTTAIEPLNLEIGVRKLVQRRLSQRIDCPSWTGMLSRMQKQMMCRFAVAFIRIGKSTYVLKYSICFTNISCNNTGDPSSFRTVNLLVEHGGTCVSFLFTVISNMLIKCYQK